MKREYGIDLLKIVAMLFIVLDHIIYWGGWGYCSGQTGAKGFVLATIDAMCLFHVNCFVLASGWIMSRLDFKMKRIIRLWLEVLGYSLAFLFLAFCIPSIHLTTKDIVKNLLPIMQDRYWFFTQYTILFFAMPMLNVAIKCLDRKVLSLILVVGLIFFSLHPFVFKTDIFHLNRGYSALWFTYLYILAGTMSVRGLFENVSKRMAICLALIGWLGCIGFLHLRGLYPFGLEQGFSPDIFRAYNCPFIVLYSVAMLLVFARLKDMPESLKRITSIIAPSVFAVYIIHSNPIFRTMTNRNDTWTGFLGNHSIAVCLLVVITTAVAIFGVCIIIDVARKFVVRILGRKFEKW